MTQPDLLEFIRAGGITLRRYQEPVARAVVDAALNRRGLSFAVMWPRQSGKNEVQAQIEAYLLWALQDQDAEIVKISPTWRPQSMNAMRRLERVLNRHPLTQNEAARESGFILRVGRARIHFLSGAPESNIVGATASTLLEVDEAQHVTVEKFDRDVLPMAASTNATRVFWGTAWNGQTLLTREFEAADAAAMPSEAPLRLAYRLSADEVGAEVPAYRLFVGERVAALGRDHPMVRTQYFSEEVAGQGGMFPPELVAMMQGSHPPQDAPTPGKLYAVLVDVAGEDKNAQQSRMWNASFDETLLENPARDATALTVVEVDLPARGGGSGGAAHNSGTGQVCGPIYKVVQRRLWSGIAHTELYEQVAAVMRHWDARRMVVDATGVGTGLASTMQKNFGDKVIPFTFSGASKSDLGWKFLQVVGEGRWREPRFDPRDAPSRGGGAGGGGDTGGAGNTGGAVGDRQAFLHRKFLTELNYCQMQLSSGPENRIRWGVPNGAREPRGPGRPGAYIHDDLVISAALCAVLDGVDWPAPGAGKMLVARGRDPIDDMKGF